MAEDFITYDRYRADLADFRGDMARFREEIRSEIALMRVQMAEQQKDMYKWFTLILVTHLAATVGLTVTLVKLIP